MNKRVRIIEHGIVLYDFTHVESPATALQVIADARAFMEGQPRGDVLVLTDITGSDFNPQIVEALKELAAHNGPWVKGSALVGLTPLKAIVYRIIVAFSRRDIRICGSRAEAMAYLLAKSVTVPSTPGAASPRTPSGPPGDPR